VKEFRGDQVLEAPEILPGFQARVNQFFEWVLLHRSEFRLGNREPERFRNAAAVSRIGLAEVFNLAMRSGMPFM
jgi:hypothetical protein